MNIDLAEIWEKIKKIDIKDIKNLKNKKELLAFFGIIFFIIAVVIFGQFLIRQRVTAEQERDMLKRQYERIMAGETDKNKLKEAISQTENTVAIKNAGIETITQREIAEFLPVFQKATGITWSANPSYATKNISKNSLCEGITVTIKNYSISYSNIKTLMNYINNSERKITIDSINISKDKITGKMTGNLNLTFYMKKQDL